MGDKGAVRLQCGLRVGGTNSNYHLPVRLFCPYITLSQKSILQLMCRCARSGRKWEQVSRKSEKWEKVGNWTQGEKRGRVSGVLSASLPLLAQEDP
eukprot:1181475-Prorocentrum_minimum.AAC.2